MRALVRSTLLLLLWQRLTAIDVPLEIRQPPTIIKQSSKEHVVDPRNNMVVECEAKGTPHPIFSWMRNGKYFNVAKDPQASMRRRSGTLDIYAWTDPGAYEGEYQCVATNEYGTAYSNKIHLHISKATLWPREVLEPVTVSVGLPLVLDCSPPPGPPKPEIYWMSKCSSGRPFNWPHQPHPPVMLPIKQDHRVSMGVNGDLYFSHVYVNDSATDYCCNARFPYKNIIQQKMPTTVRVLTTRMVSEAAPTFLSPAGRSSSQTVLQGEELLLECIAAGVPTPVITWTKDGDELDTTNIKVKNYNKLLQIPKASFEDAGEYTCTATNKMGYLEHTIAVQIKDLSLAPSAPRFFRIQQRHLDTIWVDWDTPAEPNGIITGYILKYQTVNTTREEELRVEEFPANTTSFAVRRYDRYTRYRFAIAAQTRIGVGEWYTEESPHYTTEANAREQVDLSTQGWVIGVMCAAALFVLILLVVCFIKRSRGGKYPVRDKKEVTLEPVDDNDQEGSFDYR
ncbi:neurofascin-like [Oncorhynchus nerka]|uniref:neurofascin-like n=1 Tax=Oncorhynchus nerka TaxID=8023 RepID=UPI0031B86CC6